MNTEQKVFGKLFKAVEKTELESHKIELGAIDDLRTLLNKASSSMDIQNEIISAENKLKKAQPIYDQVAKDGSVLSDSLIKMGIDGGLISSINNIVNEAKSGSKSCASMIAYLSKAI